LPARRSALILAAALLAAHAQPASPPIPPPGQIIDLGGWSLHLNCSGQPNASRPNVILEAGAGDGSMEWSLVQPGVARFARVCSYDRAGSAWSSLGPRPRTMHQIVWELHTLLAKAGLHPPFILVGHSYGGWLVRLFASIYPGEVTGLVLVETGSDNPIRLLPNGKVGHASDLAKGEPVPPVKTSGPLHESDIPSRLLKLMQDSIDRASPHSTDPPYDKLPTDAQRVRTWSWSQIKLAASNDNPFEAEELADMSTSRGKIDFPLGSMPLIVLSRGIPEEAGEKGRAPEAEHQLEQEYLQALSRKGRQIVAVNSGHHVPLDEPGLVVSSIRDVMNIDYNR
jgi:pimeloyl-ACP methyl ester carboxylesterase